MAAFASPTINRDFTQTLNSATEPVAGQLYKARPGRDEDLFVVQITGTWTGTVSIQRSAPDAASWVTIDTYTANTTEAIAPIVNGDYRAWFTTASSGTVVVKFTNT
jgi:hypothetical protein